MTNNPLKYSKVIIDARSRKERKKNKGSLRLLKHLSDLNQNTFVNETQLWNEYEISSDELDVMVNQGFLVRNLTYNQDKKITYYKLGIAGYQYLYLRKINFWLICLTIISSATSVFLLYKSFF